MIIGIGTDIIEISRIEKAINNTPKFLEKTFTENEINLFKSKGMRSEVVAGNFAAKEAFSKALGTGFRKFGLLDVEVLRDELGKPIINVSDKIINILGSGNYKMNVSISHNKSSAIAFVILEE